VDRTLYQDLHLTGKTGNLTWIVGGEGLYQNDDYRLAINSSPCAFNAINQSICGGMPTEKVCLKPLPTSANCPANYPLVFGTDS
ncbi:hypothetical protein GY663_31315, partial [Klebsiella michiganensis]|nr:hypothetical protein [Klebsiella michiganensis]